MDSNKSSNLEPNLRMRQLIESSQNFEIDRNIPISRYFKSSRELIKSAASHQESGEIEKAFLLYMRHMSLILEKLCQHPQWNKADKNDKAQARNQCNIIFDIAEKLKEQLKEKYEIEYRSLVNEGPSLKSSSPADTTLVTTITNSTSHSSPQLEDIDKKFNFKQTNIPDDASQEDTVSSLFDINKLTESLKSTK